MERQIACLYIPSFEIALARAQNAALRNRPVAVAPVHTSRALIREVSPEASAEGLQPGMSVNWRGYMSGLRLVPPDSSRVQAAHRELQQRVSLLCAGMGIHSSRLIVSGFHRHDTAFRPSHRYRHPHRTGIDPSPGMGERDRAGRQQAGLAAGCHHAETAATSPLDPFRLGTAVSRSLPATLLPGPQSRAASHILRRLDDLNLGTLGMRSPPSRWRSWNRCFGAAAGLLHDWALGIDPSPVRPPVEQPVIEQSSPSIRTKWTINSCWGGYTD